MSRVVTNKYMHTPQGVFEMKYFFHSGISSSYGESVSSVTIKQRIRKIIENEDPRRPLSDSKIVSILQREGLVLAVEEGIEKRWERHRQNHLAFVAAIEKILKDVG